MCRRCSDLRSDSRLFIILNFKLLESTFVYTKAADTADISSSNPMAIAFLGTKGTRPRPGQDSAFLCTAVAKSGYLRYPRLQVKLTPPAGTSGNNEALPFAFKFI